MSMSMSMSISRLRICMYICTYAPEVVTSSGCHCRTRSGCKGWVVPSCHILPFQPIL